MLNIINTKKSLNVITKKGIKKYRVQTTIRYLNNKNELNEKSFIKDFKDYDKSLSYYKKDNHLMNYAKLIVANF